MATRSRRGSEIIAIHFSQDISDITYGKYQDYHPAVYTVGEDYYCAPPLGRKPPAGGGRFDWKPVAEYHGRTVFESLMGATKD